VDKNANAKSIGAISPDNSDTGAVEYSSAIFGDLSAFGLDDAKKSTVFRNREAVKSIGDRIDATNAELIEKSLFLKTFKCPICFKDSKIPAVRSSSIRFLKTDTDFMPVYKEPNPLLYYVEFCRFCGFAAIPASIKNFTAVQKQRIREQISSTWKFDKIYATHYDPKTAIEIHKLALYNAVVSEQKESIKAIISLHIGWLYRIAGDEANEFIFLKTAREGFERAYTNESGSVGGLDKCSQQYLIGELLRRTGDPLGALDWYKLVLLDRGAKQKIKDMARNQKDAITAVYYSEAAHS